MHIPDGLMDPVVAAVGWLEFATVLAVALYLARGRAEGRNLPRIAVLSAGIFVAQMVNFPVGGGTTGHLIGGALFAVLVGPVLAIIGMTVVLLIQALMFGDGGIVAFGLNGLNMAIISPLVGWGVFKMAQCAADRTGVHLSVMAVAAGAWASVFVSAAACAAELTVSFAISGGTFGITPTIAVPAMLGYHAVIGLGEAAITAGIVTYLANVSPDWLAAANGDEEPAGPVGRLAASPARAALSVLIAFALVLPLYFLYASEGKDGLEQTMSEAGVEEGDSAMTAFSYGEDYFGALFAGLLGFMVVASASMLVMRLVRRGSG